MTATPEYYSAILESGPDTESLTVLVVAGASRAEVLEALGADVSTEADLDTLWEDETSSAYAAVEVAGGVLAIEQSGFADPTRETLRSLSSGGRAAAVARSNILAHERFGCARDGEILFDDNEYMYVDDTSDVPDEIRPLFDLVWDDLEGEIVGPDLDSLTVSLALAEAITGVELTEADLVRVLEGPFHRVRSLVYAAELDGS